MLTEGATCADDECIGRDDEPTCIGNTLTECDEGKLWTEMPCLSCSPFECDGGYGELCADDGECLPPLLCREKEGDVLKHCLLPCTCSNTDLNCPACDRPEFGFKYGTQRALGFCTDGWCER